MTKEKKQQQCKRCKKVFWNKELTYLCKKCKSYLNYQPDSLEEL